MSHLWCRDLPGCRDHKFTLTSTCPQVCQLLCGIVLFAYVFECCEFRPQRRDFFSGQFWCRNAGTSFLVFSEKAKYRWKKMFVRICSPYDIFLICPPQNRTPKFQWDSSNLVNAVPQWPLLQESKGKSIQFEVNADYWSQFISNSKYVSTIQNQWKPVLTFTVSIVITDRLQFRYLAQIPSQGQVKVNSPTSKSVQNNFTVQNKIGSILQRELFLWIPVAQGGPNLIGASDWFQFGDPVDTSTKTGWWWLEHGCYMTFHILGISSSQLTNSYFSEELKPPTRKWLTMDDRGSFSSRVS